MLMILMSHLHDDHGAGHGDDTKHPNCQRDIIVPEFTILGFCVLRKVEPKNLTFAASLSQLSSPPQCL